MIAARHVVTLVFSAWLAGCASRPVEPVTIFVGKNDIQASGRSFKTADELLTFLSEQKIHRISLQTEEGTDYERIGKIIYSTSRHGLRIESLNGKDVK
jgi:hypothetical protein